MSDCAKCGKKVYVNEEIKGAGKSWHKACFRCMGDNQAGDTCGISLTLKTVVAHEGKIYCKLHVPKPKATTVMDKNTESALNAPGKKSEGLGNVHKGTAGPAVARAPSNDNIASHHSPAPVSVHAAAPPAPAHYEEPAPAHYEEPAAYEEPQGEYQYEAPPPAEDQYYEEQNQ